MSYVDQQNRNRGQAKAWFTKRYNPADDVLAALDEIEQQTYKRGEDAEDDERRDAAEARAVAGEKRAVTRFDRTEAEAAQAAKDASAAKGAMTSAKEADAKAREAEAARRAQADKEKRALDAARGAMTPGDRAGPGATMREGGLRKSELEARAVEAGMDPDAFQLSLDEIEDTSREKARKEGREQSKIDAGAAAQKDASARGWAGQKETKRHNEAMEKRPVPGMAGAGGVGSKITAGEAGEVIELQTALNALATIRSKKTGGADGGAPIDTDALSALGSWFRSKIGKGDPKMTEFKALVGSNLADYIKSISGGAVSEGERAALLENVPTVMDDDEEFIGKLDAMEGMLRNKLASKQKAFGAAGKDTRIFGANPDGAPTVADFDSEPDAQ